ncbi:hypothetical protein GY45DRAFT_1319110 [Cubamyces sp. BRFM 1775]|nr:hypothetical protein GY45DRAFT_1319110 [Cubamyces sp. BRFM 1775]
MGSGFITDISTMDEAAYPVLVYRHVANSNAAYINYTPILKVWATADYEEGQLLDSNIPALPELWSGDLSAMMGLEVPLIVSRDKSSGKIAMTLKGFASPPNPDTPRSQRQTVLKADLAFASPGLVADGVNAISKLLLNKGYTIKTFSKAGSNTEIHIDLTLPQTVNCNEAELHMLAALQASPTVHGKVFVKGRSGVTLLTASPGLESWAEINPASPQWFGI